MVAGRVVDGEWICQNNVRQVERLDDGVARRVRSGKAHASCSKRRPDVGNIGPGSTSLCGRYQRIAFLKERGAERRKLHTVGIKLKFMECAGVVPQSGRESGPNFDACNGPKLALVVDLGRTA